MIPQELMDARALWLDQDRELCARHFSDFVRRSWSVIEPNPLRWNWHLDLLCDVGEAAVSGQIQNLLVCVPPGSSKSLIFSTLLPAWSWIGVDPTTRWLCSTYGQDLTDKNAKLHLDLVTSEWWMERFGAGPWTAQNRQPVVIPRGQQQIRSFKNAAGGWRISTSVGGVVTGRHADILLGDDLLKAQDANNDNALEKADRFWFKVMPTRVANAETTRKILIMQRLNDRDPAGRVIEEGGYTVVTIPMRFDPDKRTTISIPAAKGRPALELQDPREEPGDLLDPVRFPETFVSGLERELGAAQASAQLQQDPVPPGGLVFSAAHFARRWSSIPSSARLLAFVDCTFKDTDATDYVVIQVWAALGTSLYLVDERRARLDLPKTIAKILEVKADHPKIFGFYVEDKANGPGVVSALRDYVSGICEWSPGTRSKVERAQAILPVLEAGQVCFPPDSHAPWFVDYVKELTRFPKAKHDDRVDATTMALAVLGGRKIQQLQDAYAKAREALAPRATLPR